MKQVFFAMLPDVVLLDVAGAAEAFRIANRLVEGSYDMRFVAPTSHLRTGVGLELHQLPPLPEVVPDHSIVVVTGIVGDAVRFDSVPMQRLIRWLDVVSKNETVTLMCVCAGSVIAAVASGFLKYPLVIDGPRNTSRPTMRSATSAPASSTIRISCSGSSRPADTNSSALSSPGAAGSARPSSSPPLSRRGPRWGWPSVWPACCSCRGL